MDRASLAKAVHQLLGCARSQVYRVLGRFLEAGRIGLLDRRGDNGRRIADPNFDTVVRQLVESCPQMATRGRPGHASCSFWSPTTKPVFG
jgi:hypothetical protein